MCLFSTRLEPAHRPPSHTTNHPENIWGPFLLSFTTKTMNKRGPTHNETQRISHCFLSASIMLFYISVGTTAVFTEQPCDGSNKWDFYILSLYLYIHIDPPLPHRCNFVYQCRNGLLLLEEHT